MTDAIADLVQLATKTGFAVDAILKEVRGIADEQQRQRRLIDKAVAALAKPAAKRKVKR